MHMDAELLHSVHTSHHEPRRLATNYEMVPSSVGFPTLRQYFRESVNTARRSACATSLLDQVFQAGELLGKDRVDRRC